MWLFNVLTTLQTQDRMVIHGAGRSNPSCWRALVSFEAPRKIPSGVPFGLLRSSFWRSVNFASRIFSLDSLGNWTMSSEGTNIFSGDSSVYTARRNGKEIAHRAVAGKGIVSNMADAASVIVFPYMGFFAPRKIGDTLFHCQFVFGECRRYQVARLGENDLKVGSTVMGRLKLFVDDRGRMQGGDATGSSVNWIASVERQMKDYNQYLDLMAKRRWAMGTLAPRTLRDTTRLTFENKKIEVEDSP